MADWWSDLVERELPVDVDEKTRLAGHLPDVERLWFARLRDAYLEPWGTGLRNTFDLGLRVGFVAHTIASLRQRDALPEDAGHSLDSDFAWRLRHALAALQR